MDEGYLIRVETSEEIAVVVRSSSGERIYLPGEGGSDSTYYTEDPDYVTEEECSRRLVHPEEPEEVQVIR